MTNQVIAGRYEIIEEVGQGAMGVVYKARHLLMKRTVAIKMVHESLVANQVARKRFEQEAQAISSLNHPNIMTVYDFGVTEDGKPYLVVEFLQGTDLGHLNKKVGALPAERAIAIFKQACAGLAHAHCMGIIHRDIKPSNFMLITLDGQQDFVKIVDFGIAKVVQEGQAATMGLTTTGEIFGSPLYMSPEQCCGHKVDARSDIYSLGCVMYQTLTGQPPFKAESIPECLYRHVHELPLSFSQANPNLPEPAELEAIVMKALAKDPANRFQAVAELKQAIDDFESIGPGQQPVQPAPIISAGAGKVPIKLIVRLQSINTIRPFVRAHCMRPYGYNAPLRVSRYLGKALLASPSGADAVESAMSQTVPNQADVEITQTSGTVQTQAGSAVTLTVSDSTSPGSTGAAAPSPASEGTAPAILTRQPAAATGSPPPAARRKLPFSKAAAAVGAVAVLSCVAAVSWISLHTDNPQKSYLKYVDQGNASYKSGNLSEAEHAFLLAYREAHKIPAGQSQIEQSADLLNATYSCEGEYDKLTALALQEQRYAAATALLNTAILAEQKKHTANSQQVATICSDLGRLYEKQGDYTKAEQFYTRALCIRSGKATLAQAKSEPATTKELKAHLAAIHALSAKAHNAKPTPPESKSSRIQRQTKSVKEQPKASSTTTTKKADSTEKKKRGLWGGIKKAFGFLHHDKEPKKEQEKKTPIK